MDMDPVEELLRDACARFDVPGAQVGLLRGQNRSVVCVGSTTAGGTSPVQPGTAFHAGSLAKPLASSLVLAAARRSELLLDEPCVDQAPGTWDDTPRSLMSQTTGRPNLLPDPDEDIGSFVQRVGSMPRVHQPGRFSYCNAGWPVLDLLLRTCSHASFEVLARQCLGPGTTFGMPAGAAEAHTAARGRPPAVVPPDLAAAASAAGARWWTSADQLLDFVTWHLRPADGPFHSDDVTAMQTPHARVPGRTMADSWGLGWALWDRGRHRAFGWAGFTHGHRAYLRAFPEQDAALVVLCNSAGPLFGPPGGSAVFDTVLPSLLEVLGVPPLPGLPEAPGTPTSALAGDYGPLSVGASGTDRLTLDAAAFGATDTLQLVRVAGDTFTVEGDPPGCIPVAFDEDLLYVGPFAVPRS